MGNVTSDFVARGSSGRPWAVVLVEEGPWPHDSIEANLRRLQDRLYGCIDAALDGQLAAQFPESKGEAVVIRVDAYDLPDAEVRAFFDRFAAAVLELADYGAALAENRFVAGIGFELNLERLKQ